MNTRQEKWIKKGYTKEQIESYLQYERYKAKQAREKRKQNNEQNKELINTIKKDLLGITFTFQRKTITIEKINPSVDGVGFWFAYTSQFEDGSLGKFREFSHFDTYSYADFIEVLTF